MTPRVRAQRCALRGGCSACSCEYLYTRLGGSSKVQLSQSPVIAFVRPKALATGPLHFRIRLPVSASTSSPLCMWLSLFPTVVLMQMLIIMVVVHRGMIAMVAVVVPYDDVNCDDDDDDKAVSVTVLMASGGDKCLITVISILSVI